MSKRRERALRATERLYAQGLRQQKLIIAADKNLTIDQELERIKEINRQLSELEFPPSVENPKPNR